MSPSQFHDIIGFLGVVVGALIVFLGQQLRDRFQARRAKPHDEAETDSIAASTMKTLNELSAQLREEMRGELEATRAELSEVKSALVKAQTLLIELQQQCAELRSESLLKGNRIAALEAENRALREHVEACEAAITQLGGKVLTRPVPWPGTRAG